MDELWRDTMGRQLGATIDMLENALRACPAERWGDRVGEGEFWYLAYHTLFFLDLHLSGAEEGFRPPAPFTLAELDPAGVLPDRVYAPGELLAYLEHCRAKCRAVIGALTDEQARRRYVYPWGEVPFAELLVYATRHVQHHAAQLNLLLRQATGAAPRWVGFAGER